MKYKKLMLVTLVLLAILTIGAVSASDDVSSDNLTVSDDVDEVSVDASVDDEIISDSGDEKFAAADVEFDLGGGRYALESSESDILSNSTDINFNVISLSASDCYEGETATVIYHGPDGEAQITVSGFTYTIVAQSGFGVLELYDLAVGSYSATCGSASTIFKVLPRENSTGNGSGIDDGELNFIDMYICLNQAINTESGFEGVNVMGVTISGTGNKQKAVMNITSENYAFTKDLSQHFDYAVYNDDLGGTEYGINFADVDFFSSLENEATIIFEFTYNDEVLASETCTLSRNENTIRIFRGDSSDDPENYVDYDGLFVFIMDVNLGDPYSVIKVSEWPEGIADDINITLQKDGEEAVVTSWNLNDVDRDGVGYAMWNIEQLQIQDEGTYLISFGLTVNGTNKVIETGSVNIGSNDDGDINLWVNTEDEFSTATLDDLREIFASVRVPEGTNGNVTFTIDGNVLYNLALSDFDDGRIDHENNIYNIALEADDAFIFEGLKTEDVVKFAFLDENGDEVASNDYMLFFGENVIRFKESDYEGDNEIRPYIWDENDGRGILYTDSQGDVVSVDVPRNYEGIILRVYVDNNLVDEWEALMEGDEDSSYKGFGLEELGISQAGDYNIAVECDDGENTEILLNKTISVSEFNEDVFRAMILYTTETIKLYVPENAEGTVTIITEIETEDEDLEQINEEIYEITSQDYGKWKEWALSDLGFEADGAFRIFTLTVTNAVGNETYRYSVSHVGGEGQEDGDEEEFLDDIIFEFTTQDEDECIFEKASYVDVGRVFIPQKDEFDGIDVTLHIILNGQEYETLNVGDLYGFYSSRRHALGFEVPLDFTQFKDKDMLTFRLEAKFGNGESAITEDNEYNSIILDDCGTFFIGHNDIDLERFEFDVFYGNLTTGTTNNPELMGPNFDGSFVIITISNALNITEGTVTVNDGTTDIFSKSLSECDKEYDYGSVGYTYFIGLDEIRDMLPEGKDILVSFNYADNQLTQKRIRFDDYLYKIILKDDIEEQFHFEVSDELLLRESDAAIHLWTETNRNSIYIDLGGGYFIIYVNGTKVENLGNVSFNTWKDNSDWREEDGDYNDKFAPDEEAFLSYVRSYWGSELELFRLTGHSQGAPEIDITLADLGITESGTYNIRIVHYPSVPGGLDDHSTIGIFNDGTYAEEYFIRDYTEVFNGDISCNFDPDYASVDILNESRYQNGVPFLITFKFGDNVLSESNRILIYINDELAFNCTTLFYAEDDDGEMELCDLWKVTPGEFNKELLNEYGFLDAGDYNAVVYLVKGSDAPVEIGRGNFTVVKQKGNMNFTMGSTTEDGDVHTVIYADIPEGDWDGYSLEIVIDDSEVIYPDPYNVYDWFPRWYDEYVIFKDNQIYSKESLKDIIGKEPVPIDLGVLDEGTHVWVAFIHGAETIYEGWDFYQNDFTVKAASVPADSDLKVTVENIIFGETAVVNIEMDEAINGVVLVSVAGSNYTVTVTNGKTSLNISGLKAGTYDVTVKFEGNDGYNPVENTTSFMVSKITPTIEITAGEAIEGSDLEITVTMNDDATGIVIVNGESVGLVDGQAKAIIENLTAGDLTIMVNYSGDDKYLDVNSTINVNVKAKQNPNLKVTVENINFGETAAVNIEIDANVTGKVTIGGSEVIISNGKGTFNISDLSVGEHNVTVVFEGDKYFNADEKTVTFMVNEVIVPVDSNLKVTVEDINFGETAVVNIEIDANVTGKVTIGGSEVIISNGKGTFNISDLSVGEHNVTVVFEGDKYFNADEKTVTFMVNEVIVPVDPKLIIAPIGDVVEGSDVTVVVSANETFTGVVNVLVGGNSAASINVVNGSGSVTLTSGNFTVGENTVKVVSVASEYFTAGEDTATFTVTKKILPKTVTKDTFSSYFDKNGVYVADLDEIVFVDEFTGIEKITINKAISISGQDAVFTNVLFNIIADNVSVRDLTINSDSTDYAISISAGNVSLIGNNFNVVNGILISDSSNFTIDGNIIITTAGVDINGIYINRTGSGVVKNNKLNLKSVKTAYAINTNPIGPLRVSYINNTIDVESFFAVGIYDDAEEIRDNKITLSGNYAIGIAVLSENTIVDNNGITLITTNTGSEDIDEPLGVETAGIKVTNNATITNNDVDSTGKSISVVGGSSTISENNLIGQLSVESDGNTISNNVITTTEESAIDASSSTGNVISSNEAYSAQGNGDNAVKAGEGNTVNGNFEKFDPALTISVANIIEGADAVIVITTNNTFSGNVAVQIGEAKYNVSVVNGAGNKSVSDLGVNNYTAIATFDATDVFTASTKNTTFVVNPKVATALSASPVTTTYATSKNVVVTLKDANGNVLAGKKVTIVLNGASKTVNTNGKGQATLAIGTALAPKTYYAKFTFAGDSAYLKSTGSVKVTVKKATPKLTAKKKTFKVKMKTKKYTITLKTNKGKAFNKVKVSIVVKGKKYTATVKKGKATFNLKKLTKKGTYKATVTFAGNKYYNKVTVKNVKITVKK